MRVETAISPNICIAVLGAVLAACGGGNDNSTGNPGDSGVSPTPPAPAPTTPAPAPAPAPPSTNPGASPNIILIIADDLGFDSSAQYSNGGTLAPATPTLDMLATNGLVFDNLWVNPTCSPTRASILTGRYALRTGVFRPGDSLSLSETSLHAFLTGNSPVPYAQGFFGKWHLSGNAGTNSNIPNQFGISHFAGMMGGGVGDYFDWQETVNGQSSTRTTYNTSAIVDSGIDWIMQQSNPWFVWMAFAAPHTPFHLPPGSLHSRSLSGTQQDIDANPQDYYFAMIEALDTEIGRLLNSLSAEDRDNLVLLFIGDNGTPRNVAQNPPGRNRAKGTLYEGGIRTPMIAYGSSVRRGERENALINGTDLFATIAELTGISIGGINDSISFAQLLNDDAASSRDFTYSESPDGWTIRNTQFKLIQFNDGTEEMYDLVADRFESTELIASGADVSAIRQSLLDVATAIRQ